ncbi:MAG TPA: hypothetical protein VF725_02800 [Ktedonobacterales bacterium]
MDMSANLDQFLAYIAEQPNARPAFHLHVRCMPAEQPPTFGYTMPLGDVFAFPEFLVFLTTTNNKPGAGIMLKTMVEMMQENLAYRAKLARWVTHPASILVDVAKALATSGLKDNRLEQALASPNSFFVPMSQIRSVEPGRQLTQGLYIKVGTSSGSYIIKQDAAVESWWKGMSTIYLGAPWEPEFTAYLRAAASRNTARK